MPVIVPDPAASASQGDAAGQQDPAAWHRAQTGEADGTQPVVDLPVTGWTDAVWAPAGYWFLLTRGDDTVAVQRVSVDGQVQDSTPVAGYDSTWGAILSVHDDEVWVTTGSDEDPTRGPEASRLATTGGDTVVTEPAWVAADQSPVAPAPDDAGPDPSGDGSYDVPVALEHQDGVDVDLTVLSATDGWSVIARERISTTPAGQVSPSTRPEPRGSRRSPRTATA